MTRVVAWAIADTPRRRWWHRLRFWRRRRHVWLALSRPVEIPSTRTPLSIESRDL